VDIMVYRLELIPNGSSTPVPQLYQIEEAEVNKVSNTSILVKIVMLGVSGTPTSYIVRYQPMIDNEFSAASEQTQTSATNNITLSNLNPNYLYKISTQLTNASGVGNIMTRFFKITSSEEVPAQKGSPKNVGEKITAKSYLTIKGGEKTDDKYSTAYRDFSSIQLGTQGEQYDQVSIGEGSLQRNVRDYNLPLYYSFGTSVIFEPNVTYPAQGAAIGFFLDNNVEKGYFIEILPTKTAVAASSEPITIFKLHKGKQKKKLNPSTKGNTAVLSGVFAGKIYNIDVKVKIHQKTVTITAYVNGYKIQATDTTSAAGVNEILYPSQRVGLVGVSGVSMFDYCYADTIKADQYDKDYQSLNFYNGQFSTDFIDNAYGDLLYNFNNEDPGITTKQNAFDEFGTVVREIYYRKIRFGQAPAIPIKWSTGANKSVQILSQTYNKFGAQVLVLNNTSIVVPVSDQAVNSLTMLANTIDDSGEIEYSTSNPSPYSQVQPITFESRWLQNENDVKSLAEWIQDKVINKSKIISMEIFGNPLISTGDIITVNYQYQGLTSSTKIIVIKVKQRFEGGLSTEITGRTI
jgi:hypothetical protein